MASVLQRLGGRTADQLRSLAVTLNPFGASDTSILFEIGNTKVYCAVTLQKGVPVFLRGSRTGWLTAEYALLPTSTSLRSQRDSSSFNRNGRSVEISRLIGRALRSMVDLNELGEHTIVVDCDVLRADGGTRTACITAASLILQIANLDWQSSGSLKASIIRNSIAAISVGVVENQTLLDVDYPEDSTMDADYNFVLSRNGEIVEIQGSAEKKLVSWNVFEKAKKLALKGTTELFELFDTFVQPQSAAKKLNSNKVPFFSIEKRQNIDPGV